MQIKNKHTRPRRRIVIIIVVSAATVAGVLGWYVFSHSQDKTDQTTEQTSEQSRTQSTPRNTTDKDDAQVNDAVQADQPQQPGASETSRQKVNVVITSAQASNGTVNASGFVSNIVEAGGICTYVFTKADSVVRKSSDTLQNASSTTCKSVSFSSAELESGDWTVSLEYRSSTSEGSSSNTFDVSVVTT